MTPSRPQRDLAIRELWMGDTTLRDPSLFAVLDAARDERIYPRLRRFHAEGAEIVSLYQGKAMTELAPAAPYLVSVASHPDLFDWLWTDGWGNSWGIFLWSQVSADALREHLRRHTKILAEDGKRYLFRFYDPRVMRVVFDELDLMQKRDLFGPISRVSVEDAEGTGLYRYSNAITRFVRTHVSFVQAPG